MENAVILHNPRCSKSRATLELLRSRGLDPDIVLYREAPPSAAQLERILSLLGLEPRQLMRRGEAEYAALNLDNPALSRPQLIAAMVEHPILIERPIVLANGKAAIGRPPEAVLDIL
ncbi:MAG TPA: arsenate reductase (glutaredoxin) [Rhodanobacteraceae bacterium]|nr:arsenate reductase (glutaredoxin) [Rhodanobacteraceae bacterium]